jgi:hypothetical protein
MRTPILAPIKIETVKHVKKNWTLLERAKFVGTVHVLPTTIMALLQFLCRCGQRGVARTCGQAMKWSFIMVRSFDSSQEQHSVAIVVRLWRPSRSAVKPHLIQITEPARFQCLTSRPGIDHGALARVRKPSRDGWPHLSATTTKHYSGQICLECRAIDLSLQVLERPI